MRHPIELALQQVQPVNYKPGVTAADAATVSRPFALLLSEAEAVHDMVRLSLAAQQMGGGAPTLTTGPLSALRDAVSPLRDAWDYLNARMPWAGALSLEISRSTPPRRARRR